MEDLTGTDTGHTTDNCAYIELMHSIFYWPFKSMEQLASERSNDFQQSKGLDLELLAGVTRDVAW